MSIKYFLFKSKVQKGIKMDFSFIFQLVWPPNFLNKLFFTRITKVIQLNDICFLNDNFLLKNVPYVNLFAILSLKELIYNFLTFFKNVNCNCYDCLKGG